MSLYPTPSDLLFRPIEHTLEWLADPKERPLTCRELAAIIGCGHDTACLVLRGERDLEAWEERRLRDWLASCACDGMVTDHRRAPARATSGGLATLERAEVCA